MSASRYCFGCYQHKISLSRSCGNVNKCADRITYLNAICVTDKCYSDDGPNSCAERSAQQQPVCVAISSTHLCNSYQISYRYANKPPNHQPNYFAVIVAHNFESNCVAHNWTHRAAYYQPSCFANCGSFLCQPDYQRPHCQSHNCAH